MMAMDYLPGTNYRIKQSTGMFRLTTDSELLGKFIEIRHKDHVLDVGCNSGVLLLYAAEYMPASLTGIDIFPESIELARQNLSLNSIQAELICARIQDLSNRSFDVMLCNPPYFTKQVSYSRTPFEKAARNEDAMTIGDLFESARRLLKSNGRLFLVYPAAYMNVLCRRASEVKLFLSRLRPVYTLSNSPARFILAEFRFQENRTVRFEPPVMLHTDQKAEYTGK